MKKSIYSIGKAMDKANSVVEVFTGYMIFAFMALLFLQVPTVFRMNTMRNTKLDVTASTVLPTATYLREPLRSLENRMIR